MSSIRSIWQDPRARGSIVRALILLVIVYAFLWPQIRENLRQRRGAERAAERARSERVENLPSAQQSPPADDRGCGLTQARVVGGKIVRKPLPEVYMLLDHAEDLDLTQGQISQLSAARDRDEKLCREGRQRLEALEERLEGLLSRERVSQAEVMEASRAATDERKRLEQAHLERFWTAFDVLTAEQRRKAEEWLPDAGSLIIRPEEP